MGFRQTHQWIEDLRVKSAYPKAEQSDVEMLETHLSWVFLVKDRVYKLKKPVDFGFVNFTTLEARKDACEAEVKLNRRLAPDVYLGIRAVYRSLDGTYSFVVQGAVVDWAVYMRRLPQEVRADTLLSEGDLDVRKIDLLARQIAEFHAHCMSNKSISELGKPEAIRVNVEENFEQTRSSITACISQEEANTLRKWQLDFLGSQHDRFMERVHAGHIRDGHGDLRLEHAYWIDGKWTIIDCIEFNDRFRYADTCADVAFMAMDLSAQGQQTLSERFVAQYAIESNDFGLYPLLDFYQSYRAYVRGKVALLSREDASEIAPELLAKARHYFLLSLAVGHKPFVPPRVIAVGGMIASGKSTLADRLAMELACPVVDTDRTRKHMLGVDATTSMNQGLWTGAYDEAVSHRVYAELFTRARQVLDSKRSVVLDASFRTAIARQQAKQLANEYGLPFLFIECQVSKDVALERLTSRSQMPSVSDARSELYESFFAAYEPVHEFDSSDHMVVQTIGNVDETVAKIRDFVFG